jgi:hypothetical protein
VTFDKRAREAVADIVHEHGWELPGKSSYDIADMILAAASAIHEHRNEPGLSPAEQKAQGARCGCQGADDYCVCQNVPDTTTRAERDINAKKKPPRPDGDTAAELGGDEPPYLAIRAIFRLQRVDQERSSHPSPFLWGCVMGGLCFRLTENNDPEERLEEAALWKAMHDEYGEAIEAITPKDERPGAVIFGRGRRFQGRAEGNPVPEHLPYWGDKAFLAGCHRVFDTVPYAEVQPLVSALHAMGKGAFIKSTRPKHAIVRVPIGRTVFDEFDALALSFIDGGPPLMVQEECEIEYEHRFFVIDREVVTHSPIQWALTPLDYPLAEGCVYRTPKSKTADIRSDIVADLFGLAKWTATAMRYPHASIDCALINGEPGVVEFNPMQLGQLGLYACDVRALARASRKLLPSPPTVGG